jgi:transposase-like protein
VRVLAEAVMEAEVGGLTGAAKGERAPDRRLTSRNGYRERRWDTRVGTMNLSIPRVRDGSSFPSLLEPRRRAERALVAVVQEAHALGVSTRRVEDLVEALGIASLSRTEVSRICAPLDAEVEAFRNRWVTHATRPTRASRAAAIPGTNRTQVCRPFRTIGALSAASKGQDRLMRRPGLG